MPTVIQIPPGNMSHIVQIIYRWSGIEDLSALRDLDHASKVGIDYLSEGGFTVADWIGRPRPTHCNDRYGLCATDGLESVNEKESVLAKAFLPRFPRRTQKRKEKKKDRYGRHCTFTTIEVFTNIMQSIGYRIEYNDPVYRYIDLPTHHININYV